MRSRKKKLFKIYLFSFIILFFIILLFLSTGNLFLKYRELKSQNEQVLTKIKGEEEKAGEIKKKLDYLRTPYGQERVLIKNNNLKRPGERVIKILDY